VLGESKSYVLRGFDINTTGAIGSSANSLQMLVSEASFLHGTSDVSGTFFVIPSGTPNETLSSITNTKVQGSFVPSTLNYVSLEFVRAVDDSTTGQRYFWNPTTKAEFTKVVPLAELLDYNIIVSSSIFPSNVLPVAIIETDTSNNVLSVEDRRPLLFRLGTAGDTTPDPIHEYPWTNDTEGRVENFYKSTTSTSPFHGGDKQIKHLKEWMDAVMSMIKEVKGTPYWYSINVGGSLAKIREDIANTVITGTGVISHDAVTSGKINWSSDMFMDLISSRLSYKIASNAATTDIILADDEVAYIKIVRGQTITPNLIYTNGSPTVTSVGSVSWTMGLVAGDFVKIASELDTKYYKILSVDSLFQVTLTVNFADTSTGSGGAQSQYAYGVYQTDPAPSTDRHLKIDAREDVPFDEDHFWLFFRKDNGGSTARVYIRGEGELEKGEDRQIDDGQSLNILSYIGSPSEVATQPAYSSSIRGTALEDLTDRIGVLTDAVGDEQEDRSAYLRSDEEVLWDGTDLTFTSDIVLELINTKSGTSTEHIILAANSPITINDQESLYIEIDRAVASENVTPVLSDTTPIPAQTQTDKDIFVLFRRLDNGVTALKELYSPFNKQLYTEGQSFRIGQAGSGKGIFKVDFLDPVSTTLPTGATVTIDGISGVDGDLVLFTNLTLNNNKVYKLGGVGVAITWTAQKIFDNGSETPFVADLIIVRKGIGFANQIAEFDGTNWKVNDTIRMFDGVSADFWEMSSIKTSTLANNTTGNIFSVTVAGSENFVIPYSIFRGSTKETGILTVTSDGVSAEISRSNGAFISSVGVDIFADISAGNIRLRFTTDNSGSSAMMKYFVQRWSNSAGGPSGIPNYAGGGGGGSTIAAGAVQDVQFHGVSGFLDADTSFKWDGSQQAINLNDLYIGKLLGPLVLNDNQAVAATLFTYSAASFKSLIIEYSIDRNTTRRTGTIKIANTGVAVADDDQFAECGGASGVVFSTIISGGNVSLQYVSTSTGFSGSFEYSIRKWL
jgi:hypothetical protein